MSVVEDRHEPEPTELPSTEAAAPASGASERIGPYRLVEKIGEGGMGEVWLAEQDEPVRRKVALKVIKQGMDTKQVVARFEAERQALALMDHPAIAKIYDAGATPRGRPYFAMEHVPGVPITDHCDRLKLSNRQRLELFREVCDGVQHAHHKAVIHRDLKPSNVLVSIRDGKAVPKIIDFGVAKATAQRLTEQTLHTQLGVLIGTPAYMSPEQAEMTGQDVDTRTDVYALGVMLYELTVGALPFDPQEFRNAGFQEIVRKIRDDEPPKPSTRLSTLGEHSTQSAERRRTELPALRRELSGDLDWITMKAMDKDRTRRYGSPQELSADIERFLTDQPVLASPPSTSYRAKKFVRRHRLGVLAATLVILALGLGLAGAAVGFLRAVRAERETRREAETATSVSDFLRGLFQASMPSVSRGDEISVREMLDQGAKRIEIELDDQPLVQARLLQVMGEAYGSLSLDDRAAPLIEKAVAIREQMLGEEHPETLESKLTLGLTYKYMPAHWGESWALIHEVFETRRRLLGEEHPDTLAAMAAVAHATVGTRRAKEMEPLYVELLTTSRRALGDEHETTLWAMGLLALHYANYGRHEEAERLYREELEMRRRLDGEDHPKTLTLMWKLAALLLNQDRLEDAEALCQKLVDGRRLVLGPDHAQTLQALGQLATLRVKQERFREAEDTLQEILELCGGRGDGEPGCRAGATTNLGRNYYNAGSYEHAARHHRAGLEIKKEWLGPDHPSTLRSMIDLGGALIRQGNHRQAATVLTDARDRFLRAELDSPDLGLTYFQLACLSAAQGDREQALERLRRAAEKGRLYRGSLLHRALLTETLLDPLRGTPGFESLLAEVE